MTLATRRLTVRLRPHVGFVGAGLLAVLAGCPVLAQAINGPAALPAESPLIAPSAPSPATSTTPPAAAAPEQPTSPFGPAPGVFPTILPAPPSPDQPASPFEPAPGVFPTISPAPSSPEQPASPFGPAPGVFPGLAPEPSPSAAGQPISPLEFAPGLSPETSPAPSAGATPAQPASAFGPAPGTFPGIQTGLGFGASPFLAPGYGFGFSSALGLGGTAGAPAEPPAPLTTIGLQPLRPGAIPVQAGNNRAPPILIAPTVTLSESYTDNPRNTADTFSDLISRFGGGTAISVDSVRLQGQLNGSLDYYKYARATDLDQLNANLLAYGLGTIIPDHLFIDGRATMTQLSTNGGLGFANATLLRPSQQTQAEIVSLTPILRQSFDGYVDGELRYNYGLNLFQNGGLLNNTTTTAPAPATTPSNALANSTVNDATLSLATGRRFTFFGSKLTLDATTIDSQSPTKSTQLRGFDDVEYQFNQVFSALGRVGYENIDYPLQPAASTTGPIWLIGGRVTLDPSSYMFLRYGRQDGFYGLDGALRYQLTAATTILASLQHNLSSSQQDILTNLNSSQVDAYGNVVNQVTGLPSALVNPEFGLSNNITRQEQARIGMQTHLDPDTYSIFAFVDHQSALGPTIPIGGVAQTASGSDTSRGFNFTWGRSLTPRLTSGASLGYASTVASHQKTLTAELSLTYTLNPKLNAVLHYQFINVDSANVAGGSATGNASYRRNQVEIALTRSF